MDPETTEVVPVADEPRVITIDNGEQKTEPEPKAEVAHPVEDGEAEEVKEPEGEKLTDDQKTIRNLRRRIDKLNGKVGATARERELLLAELQQRTSGDESEAKPDVERIATERAQEIVKAKALNEKAEAVLKSGKRIEGFQSAVETLRDEIPFADSKGRPTAFLEAVLDLDSPAKVIKYLGDNPDEASEFADLSPVQIGRRLAKLESKLEGSGKTKSNAPAPIEPLGGARSSVTDLSSAAMDDYIKLRAKQGAAWSRWRK